MSRCLELAKNSLGKTYPNPLVGCVIVWNDQIIGEGWHQKAGKAHAEVNAIYSVKDPEKLKEATLYVNLEPCSHHGKTPPCSDLILEKGIKKVVIGSVDPNPQVAGQGIKKLEQACETVIVGVLEEECEKINKRFFTFQRAQRPYVILKWAETQDGFIAPKDQVVGKPVWITNPYSKQLAHKWRTEEQGILVGLHTALKDNPQLNSRLWKGNDPTRILIDPHLESISSSRNLHLTDHSIKTIIFCENPPKNEKNLFFERINFKEDTIPQILKHLYNHNIQSLIVEGGRETLQFFIASNLWDEARIFTGSSYFKNGIAAPAFHQTPVKTYALEQDILNIYQNS